jgi:hypothetical protein
LIQALLLDLLVIVGLSLLGFLLAKMLIPAATRIEFVSLAYPLGSGILAWGFFGLSWLGVRISLFSVVLVLGVLILLGIIVLRRRLTWHGEEGDPLLHRKHSGAGVSLSAKMSLGIIGVLFLIAAAITVGRSYSHWDALAIWSVKGYGIALEGSIFAGEEWGAYGLGYPLNLPLQVTLFKLASGDILPGSKLIFPMYYLSMLLGCFVFWRRNGLDDKVAGFGMVLLATVPHIYHHATIGYANLPMTCYLVLGSIYGVRGIFSQERGTQLLCGIMLALASFTRVEGFLYACAILAGLMAAKWFTRRGKIYPLALLGLFILLSGCWLIFNRLYGASAGGAISAWRNFMTSVQENGVDLHPLRIILGYMRRYLFHISIWGLLFPLTGILLLSRLRELLPGRNPLAFAWFLVTIGTGIVTVVLFYVGNYVYGDVSPAYGGLFGWLKLVFPRSFFPTSVLLTITAILLHADSKKTLSAGTYGLSQPDHR